MYGMINVETHGLINIEMHVKEIVETHAVRLYCKKSEYLPLFSQIKINPKKIRPKKSRIYIYL